MFKKSKKLVAVILAVALALASVSAVSAAKSPTKNDPKPGKQKVKSKDQDTTEVLVDKGKGITAIKIANVKKATVGGTVKVGTVNGKTTNVPVDSVGTKALDGNKKTTKLTTTKTVTTIKSKALVGSKVKDVVSKVSKKSTLVLKSESLAGCSSLKTFEANGDKKAEDGAVEFGYKTFNNTKISSVTVRCSKVTFDKGSFHGIKKGTKTYIELFGVTDSHDLKVKRGAFDSNSKKMTIKFSYQMSVKEYRKAMKILKDGGFQGKIARNRKTKKR